MRNIDPRRLEALRTVERAYRDMVVRSLSVPDEEILKEPGVGPKTLRKRRRADIERWTFARGSRMAYERGGGSRKCSSGRTSLIGDSTSEIRSN